ncbi:MAG: sulfite reductase subunit A, partial [Candidatus Zixiibacteriota bacterium]
MTKTVESLSIHDKIFTQGPYVDRAYQERRRNLFVVAVNCVHPGGTCFCASTNTGPKASSGFDLALTELHSSSRHSFVVEPGSKEGKKLISKLPVKQAQPSDIAAARKEL